MDYIFAHMDNLSLHVLKSLYIFTREVANRVSLQTYKLDKEGISHSDYIMSDCFNFRAAQVKCTLWSGVLGFWAAHYHQIRGSGLCNRCNVLENAKHFILQCPAYNSARQCLHSHSHLLIRLLTSDNPTQRIAGKMHWMFKIGTGSQFAVAAAKLYGRVEGAVCQESPPLTPYIN